MSGKITCTCESFGAELGIILKAYDKDLNAELKKDVQAAAKVALKEVKTPPPGAGVYRDWDDYESGWGTKSEEMYGNFSIRIRNKKKPGLTHLLEKGHIVHTKDETDGKRRARAFPHIAPAAEKANAELTRRIEEGGGRLK